jgi:hypothetical protein
MQASAIAEATYPLPDERARAIVDEPEIPAQYRTKPMSLADAGTLMRVRPKPIKSRSVAKSREAGAKYVRRLMSCSDPARRLRFIPVGQKYIFDARQLPDA